MSPLKKRLDNTCPNYTLVNNRSEIFRTVIPI